MSESKRIETADQKQRRQDRQRKGVAEKRARRIANGLCSYCGSEREDKELQLCNGCRNKKRNTDADNMSRGLCRNCGGKREDLTVQHCDKCREAQRKTQLKKLYGITVEDYDRMLEEQNGVCWICAKAETTNGGTLHIDHDTQSGKVRGLLCGKCNRAIGLLNHSPELLERAVQYMREFSD
jgi:hypothetical protein